MNVNVGYLNGGYFDNSKTTSIINLNVHLQLSELIIDGMRLIYQK